MVRTLLIGRDHVQESVAIHIGYFELRAHAAVVVDFVRCPNGSPIFARQLEPDDYGRMIGVRVPLGPWAHHRLPVMKSGNRSPLMSARHML